MDFNKLRFHSSPEFLNTYFNLFTVNYSFIYMSLHFYCFQPLVTIKLQSENDVI